ncbi:MAG: hypothetical protein E7378_02340 [Clostridiales bacterium]|nr:hypothetical protein [Clostridiales bacterium]
MSNQTKEKFEKIAEQEAIMGVCDKNLIVSASAGSGKTTVMIRKILSYILNKKCHTNELLVLTYTNAAGQEMKKKLIDKLKDNLNQYDFLEEELELAQTADIGTFDSFCQKLVKKYFYYLNVDPAFNVLQGGDETFLQGEIIAKAIKQLRAEEPLAYENLIESLSPRRDEEIIKQIVLQIYSYMNSILKDEEFLERTLNLYCQENEIAENFLCEYYNSKLKNFVNLMGNLKEKANNLSFSKYLLYANNFIIQLEKLICEKQFAKKIDLINGLDFGKLNKEDGDEIGLKDQISAVRAKAKYLLDEDLKKNYISAETIKNSYKYGQKLTKNLIKLLKIFKELYKAEKIKGNTFDFNDIERMAIDLLENAEINQEIKNEYKYIFIDEFQDANAVQEKIIFLLGSDNLFFVGDTKQSIYAFRQSDPEIFLNIQNNFKNDKTGKSLAKKLNCNFRTNANILNFVNNIFKIIMTEKTCALDYFNDAMFVPKAKYKELPNEVNVELNVLVEDEQNQQKPKIDSVYSVKQNTAQVIQEGEAGKECYFVANKILELIGQDIYDKESQTTKKVDFSDITILVAKRSKFFSKLVKKLGEIGIPYIVNVNDNLEEFYDNRVLFNLLKYTLNSQDDYALYMLMSSALFNFSNQELGTIRMQFPDEKNFYECVDNFVENFSLDKFKHNDSLFALGQKLENMQKILSGFAFDVKYKGIYFALDKIIRQTNYLLNISFEENFAERKLNICEYVDSFASSKYNFDLCEYIIYRETSLRSEKVQADKKFANAVQITTMHSSKGLEYPIVILPNLAEDFTKEPTGAVVKINKDFGVGIKSFDSEDRTVSNGIFYNACKLKNKQIELSEKIRLLYVAMTRAKNKLIMVGTANKQYTPFKNDYDILNSKDYLNFILGCLNKELDAINNAQEYSGNLFGSDKAQINILKVEIEDIKKQEFVLPKVQDKDKILSVKNFLQKDIRQNTSQIALKNSVSEFAFADDYSSVNFAPKTFAVAEHLTEKANEVGTLYHELLEKIDFFEVNMLDDVASFVECNFSAEQIMTLKKIGYNNIFNNIQLIKSLFAKTDKLLKEQKFVMYLPLNQVTNEQQDDKILVQGIIDLVAIRQDGIILIDYKLSSKSAEEIKERYAKQVGLYELALKKRFNGDKIDKYIVDLSHNKLIKMY